jgi:hypothetical protein
VWLKVPSINGSLTGGLSLPQGLIRIAAIAALVDGAMNPTYETVPTGLLQDLGAQVLLTRINFTSSR